MDFQIKNKNGLFYGTFPAFDAVDVLAAVSFRKGGVSRPPFQSLNPGLHTGDGKSAVLENRRRFLKVLKVPPEDIVTLKQVHGKSVVWARDEDRGRGAADYEDSLAPADAVLTAEKNLPLVIFTADCCPLFFFEKKRRIAGLAHAGWKGTELDIAGLVVGEITDRGGSAGDILCAIGPSIGPCCYEVGEDLAGRFEDPFIRKEKGKMFLDLPGINRALLIKHGIPEKNILASSFCASCHNDLCYSHRKEGRTGRMASVIMMK